DCGTEADEIQQVTGKMVRRGGWGAEEDAFAVQPGDASLGELGLHQQVEMLLCQSGHRPHVRVVARCDPSDDQCELDRARGLDFLQRLQSTVLSCGENDVEMVARAFRTDLLGQHYVPSRYVGRHKNTVRARR